MGQLGILALLAGGDLFAPLRYAPVAEASAGWVDACTSPSIEVSALPVEGQANTSTSTLSAR
jgi:hypothetical protein